MSPLLYRLSYAATTGLNGCLALSLPEKDTMSVKSRRQALNDNHLLRLALSLVLQAAAIARAGYLPTACFLSLIKIDAMQWKVLQAILHYVKKGGSITRERD